MTFVCCLVSCVCLRADVRRTDAAALPAASEDACSRVTVTADRGLAGINDSASSVAVLSQQQIEQSAGFALDDALHAVSGFQLFRRHELVDAEPHVAGA